MSLPDNIETNSWGEELRALVRLAAPFALAQGGQALMGLVDTAVVGRAGAIQLAGTALGIGLFFAISVLGIGATMGLDPLISQAVGARQPERARRLVWQGIWLALLGTAVLALPMIASPLAFPLFGIGPRVQHEATRFLYWRIPGLLPLLLFFAQRSYLQAKGRAAALLWNAIWANAINAALDFLFVFGGAGLPKWTLLHWVPAMGAAGAALSTDLCTLAQVLGLAWTIRAIRVGELHDLLRPMIADLRRTLRVGVPIGLHMGAEVGVFALAGLFAGHFGATSLAAHQIALQYGSLSFCFAIGIGNAGSVRVGWAVGAGKPEAARRSGLTAFVAGIGFMSFSALVFFTLPALLARGMTSEASVVSATVPLLAVAAVFQLSDGVQGVGAGVLRGLGDSHFTFYANVLGHYAIGLPVALYLGFTRALGITGVWWGLCVGLTAVAIALVSRFWRLSARGVTALAET
jgi:MATE family multidrug resistance protein